jgi:hypothetical protein
MMTHDELDRLLAGADGLTMRLTSGAEVWLDRRALEHPPAWRSAMRRAMGHVDGWQPPVYGQADHDQVVRAIFRLVEAQTAAGATV